MPHVSFQLILVLALGGITGDGTADVARTPTSTAIVLPPPSPPPELPPCVRPCVAEFQQCTASCGALGACGVCVDTLRACLRVCGVVWIPTDLGADGRLESVLAEKSRDAINRRTP